MFTAEIAVLLVADAEADQWLKLIHEADAAVRIHSVPTLRAVQDAAARIAVGVVCLDGVIAGQSSTTFIAEQIARAQLPSHVPIIVLTRDADIAARFGGRMHDRACRVLLCRNQAEYAACVMEFRYLLTETRMQMQLQLVGAALEGASNGVAVIDARKSNRPIVYANAALAALSGYEVGEIVGKSCDFMQGDDTGADNAARLQAALQQGGEFKGELIYYRKDGAPFWDRLALRPWHGAGGTLEYFVATHEDVTDGRRLRDRLRASEARLELAMSASELAMWDWNVDTGDIYYNDQWQALLEVPAEELLLRDSLVGRLVLPEGDHTAMSDLEKHLSGETPQFEREFEIRTASGKTKSVLARANAVRRAPDGHALRVIGVWRDVTARKASLRTIEETHKRWERAVAGTSDGLFDWDLSSGYVWYAPRFRDMLGYSDQEFNATFSALQRVMHDDDRLTVLTKIRNHLEQRVPLDLQCRVLCKSGEYRWVRLRGSAERDPAGRPRRLSGSIRDITGQIDAEQALHRSEGFYSAILDALPTTVAFIDCDQRIIYLNRASAELVAKDPDQLRGRLLSEVLTPELYADLAPHLHAALNGQSFERELRTQDARGQAMDVDITFLPHADAQHNVQGCFLMARNVTARVKLEAELRQSQKMEAIGKLTGGVAHDFNNLLSVAIGNAQLLSRTLKDSPRLHKQAETILRAAMRGAELTRRLLTFARQQQTTLQVVKVNELISGMFDLLRRTLPGDIELSLDLDDAIGGTSLDAGQFENALLNLVVNARDAMHQGGAISVRTANVTLDEPLATLSEAIPAGDYVRVSVADTGSGINPKVLARVFEPFFTTKEFGKGSGLGLAMVNGFVKHCSGGIVIQSELGKGTQVDLYLARAHEPTVSDTDSTIVVAELPRGDETILVVDDNADVRATVVEMLSSVGYRVLQAGSSREALQLAAHEPSVQLLFADLMLPGGMSSSVLTRKLRELHPDIKVLMTSGFSDTMITHRSALDGSIELLHKPYELTDLARRVRAVLDGREEKLRVPA